MTQQFVILLQISVLWMRKVIVLSRVSTMQQDLKQQTEEILREVYKDSFNDGRISAGDGGW